MKVLLDECVPRKLKHHFGNHEVSTVPIEGLAGLKNGQLLASIVDLEFQVFVTVDKNILFQQNIGLYPVIIVVLDAQRSIIDRLITLLDKFEEQLPGFEPGNLYIIKEE
ncbi:MAG: hypothetical protein AAF741_16040 [Bacteroidota bacterium]